VILNAGRGSFGDAATLVSEKTYDGAAATI
jgi:hypothetical protein